MATSMMSRFVESGFQPVEFEGEIVHPMYTVDINERDHVRVTWIDANSPRVQGLTLRLRIPGRMGRKGEGGLLRVGDAESPSIILWMDTAPEVVDAECIERADGAVLQVSNRWRLPDGREDEWLNNYGIKLEPVGQDALVLHCSDGYGDAPSFDDLIVRLDVVRGNHA
jgi:hypothetical protein